MEEVDFYKIIDHLKAYAENDFNRSEVNKNKEYAAIEQSGESAIEQINLFIKKIADRYNLSIIKATNWLEGGEKKVRRRIWADLGFGEEKNHNIELSFFAENIDKKITFRIVGWKNYSISEEDILSEGLTNKDIYEKLNMFLETLITMDNESFSNLEPIKSEDINLYEKNIILYGPPGTGKTYNSVIYAVAIIEDKELDKVYIEPYSDILNRYNQYKEEKQINFTTFHQSFGYEEFIEGIKPITNSDKDELTYKIEDGQFKEFCNAADKMTDTKNFVFIIDEINRGNISKILGELITLIEPSKRKGNKEAMSVKLPYSKDEFSVPKNVYIIGTMNTADRSIALLDTALRRRFNFIEMMPNTNLFEGLVIENIDIKKMIETINKRIEVLYDREHMIGHAYFFDLIENSNISVLGRIFKNSIIPLLQEYFYEDFSRIQLILGDNAKANERKFILDAPLNMKTIFKGNPEIDLFEKNYKIQNEAFTNAKSYIEIYE